MRLQELVHFLLPTRGWRANRQIGAMMPARVPRSESRVQELEKLSEMKDGAQNESGLAMKRPDGARGARLHSSLDGVCDLLQAQVNALKNESALKEEAAGIEEGISGKPAPNASGAHTTREYRGTSLIRNSASLVP